MIVFIQNIVFDRDLGQILLLFCLAREMLLFQGFHRGRATDVGDGVGAGDDAVRTQVDPLALPRLHNGAEGDEGARHLYEKE